MGETIRKQSDLLGRQIYKNAISHLSHMLMLFTISGKRRRHRLWQVWFTEGLVGQKLGFWVLLAWIWKKQTEFKTLCRV